MLLCLAPMDWITDSPYRIIVKEIFDKYWDKNNQIKFFTEFMSSDWYVHNPAWVVKHIIKTEIETPLVAQIFGWDKNNLVQTAKDIEKYNYEWIELNTGCPSPKIMACWWWSWTLKNKEITLDIIKSLSQNIKTPFSIKTRIWLNNEDKENQFNFIVESSKFCKLISVHGRLFTQWHSWNVDWNFIYEVKNKADKNCQIVWNWWINSYSNVIEKVWNLDWIMIWQSAIWNPWIFTQHTPSHKEVYETIIRHLELFVWFEMYFKKAIEWFTIENKEITINMPKLSDYENLCKQYDNLKDDEKIWIKAAIEFRKHIFSYIKWIPWNKEFKQKIIFIREYKQLRQEITNFFENII